MPLFKYVCYNIFFNYPNPNMKILLNSNPALLNKLSLEVAEQKKQTNILFCKIMATRLYNYLSCLYEDQAITIDIYFHTDDQIKTIDCRIDNQNDTDFHNDLHDIFSEEIYDSIGDSEITFTNNEEGRHEMLQFFVREKSATLSTYIHSLPPHLY